MNAPAAVGLERPAVAAGAGQWRDLPAVLRRDPPPWVQEIESAGSG